MNNLTDAVRVLGCAAGLAAVGAALMMLVFK